MMSSLFLCKDRPDAAITPAFRENTRLGPCGWARLEMLPGSHAGMRFSVASLRIYRAPRVRRVIRLRTALSRPRKSHIQAQIIRYA